MELINTPTDNTVNNLTKSHTEFVLYNNRFREENHQNSPIRRHQSVTQNNLPKKFH